MLRPALTLLAAAALATACNASTLVDSSTHGAGGSGGGGAGGGATTSTSSTATSTVPEACRVQTEAAAPYAFTFRMTNATGTPAFVFDMCGIELTVTACADGYAAPLPVTEPCSYVRCAEGRDAGCPGTCGACDSGGRVVTADAPVERAMPGVTYSTGNAYCACTDVVPLPAAKYRVRVPVWASKEDAESHKVPGWEASVDFELPAPGGVVEIPVGAH